MYIVTDSQGHISHIEIYTTNIHNSISKYEFAEETLKKYQDLQILYVEM